MPTDTQEMPVVDTHAAMTATSLGRCDLSEAALLMLRLAALSRSMHPPASYLVHIGAAAETGVTLEDAQNVLVAVAPIVGTARVMSAAINIAEALGLAVIAFEDDTE